MIPESESGILRSYESAHNINLNIFKKYIAKFPNYPKKRCYKRWKFHRNEQVFI